MPREAGETDHVLTEGKSLSELIYREESLHPVTREEKEEIAGAAGDGRGDRQGYDEKCGQGRG